MTLIVTTKDGFSILTVDSKATAQRYLDKTYKGTNFVAMLYGSCSLLWSNIEVNL